MTETMVEFSIGVILFALLYRSVMGKWPWQTTS
jgi:hypothetical protein